MFIGNQPILTDTWISLLVMIKKQKISTVSTLLFRASSLPTIHEGKIRETSHFIAALEANGYPSSVISTILNKKPPSPTVPPPEELVSIFFQMGLLHLILTRALHASPTSVALLSLLRDLLRKNENPRCQQTIQNP